MNRQFSRALPLILSMVFAFAQLSEAASSAAYPHSRSSVPTAFANRKPVLTVTPDLPKLSWKLENGVKVFHLIAEPVKREIMPANGMAPAKVLTVWGYNGTVPGPTIEINEGDHIRVIFQNKLPEGTTIHWHGLEIPIDMDGMPGISQPMVKPGETFIYDFTVNQNGTFFYHSHGAMQEMMGMIGLFIVHPKKDYEPHVDKDFGLILQEWAALPNNPIPNSMSMEFNWLTINGKAAPATTPLIIKEGERVRIRLVNLGMDHHPIHIHGNQFYVTGTEGGRSPQSTWYPGNTVLVGVAQARDIEFVAKHPGDWMLHCHLPHHMMNNMVSMVGPMTMTDMQHGMPTGMGMQEGMGIVRQGNATSGELGPGLGRGMSITADRERNVSHEIHQNQEQNVEIAKDVQSKPGYPQDEMMMMPVDAAVAKPENNYLAPGWSASLQGMMSLVRVLPAAKYDKLMADIRSGHIDPAQLHGGMDHMNMSMPGMNRGNMQMDQGKMQMDQGKMQMDHGKMPGMDAKAVKMHNPSSRRNQAVGKTKRSQPKAKPMTMEEMMRQNPNMKM